MNLCYILLKTGFGQKGNVSDLLILCIGVPIVLFINFLIGGAIRQLYGTFIANEKVSDEDFFTIKGFFVNSLWGVFGTIAISWLLSLWTNLPLK
ncbi:MAG: hypothetical protein RLZZ71_2132 [Bacteroidota bacterium]|jgi:uncharacterized membrane protein YeaQ/YmgE (transglycosylase-associated protein family)